MERANVGSVELEYELQGSGEPLLLIHGAHIADAMRPLRRTGRARPVRADPATTVPVRGQRAARSDADDGPSGRRRRAARPPRPRAGPHRRTLLRRCDRPRAGREPPDPRRVAGFARTRGPGRPGGRSVHGRDGTGGRTLPGGRFRRGRRRFPRPHRASQLARDHRTLRSSRRRSGREGAATFFEIELPAGAQWSFGPERAAAISCPVLSVLGTDSGPLFAEGRDLLHEWFPKCEDTDIAGATHLLQMEAPAAVASASATFLNEPAHRAVSQ